MSYESRMLEQLAMPRRAEVQNALLRTLLKHGGVVKEFAAGEEVVDELADRFRLNPAQRTAALETVYRKENRLKKTLLWHRLLFRAADALATDGLVSRPTQTSRLTGKREWMLTEKGFDEALRILQIPAAEKDSLPIKSYEVQKLVKKLYDFRCAVCGLKINSPDNLCWQVETAHIVPDASFGRDDLFNGIALCRFHHWAFDVGWFSFLDHYKITVSSKVSHLPPDFGRWGDYELIRALTKQQMGIRLPRRRGVYPHINSIRWHRQFIFVNDVPFTL